MASPRPTSRWAPGLTVVLAGSLLVAERLRGLGHQVRARFLEVVVGVGIGSGPYRTAGNPFGDVFDVAPGSLPLEMVLHRFIPGSGLQLVHRIGENQRMNSVAMLEEVHDAFMLEQSLNEIQVALVVLDAILAWWIGALQSLLKFG